MSRALCLVLEFDHLCALLARCEDIFTQLPSDILQSQYLYTAAKCFYQVNTFTQLRSDILQSRWVRHFTQEDWRCNICRGAPGKQIFVHIWKKLTSDNIDGMESLELKMAIGCPQALGQK